MFNLKNILRSLKFDVSGNFKLLPWSSVKLEACYVKRLNGFCVCVRTDKIRAAFKQSTETLS